MSFEQLKQKALSLGATDFRNSNTKGKRYDVKYDNKWIPFGSATGKTFIDHKDKDKKKAWQARHSKIKNKDGQLVHKLKTSPSYWSWNILW